MDSKESFTKVVIDYKSAYNCLYSEVADMLVSFKEDHPSLQIEADQLLSDWDYIRKDLP